MFSKGELEELVTAAANDLGLFVGPSVANPTEARGIEIVQRGWERSNHYVELKRW